MIKTIFRVTGMECPNCAMRLESLEDTLPGIQHIDASYRKARMDVVYDERLLTADQIVAAIKALGYTAMPE